MLALSMVNLTIVIAGPIALEAMYSSLTNLAVKASELKIQNVQPLSPATKHEVDNANNPAIKTPIDKELDPLISPTVKDYKEFYPKLRAAISQSLITRKLDSAVFIKLKENPAKRTAQYILERLFEPSTTGGTAYKINTTYNNETSSTFQFAHTSYKPISTSLDIIVDQILLISRLVDYIVTNFKNDDVSILSIDAFKSVFNTYFAMALSKERTKAQFNPDLGKLNFTILSDSLDEEDFNRIKESIKKLEGITNHYTIANELVSNEQKFDIYLLNGEFRFDNEATNIKQFRKDKDRLIFCAYLQNAIAIASKDFPEDIRNSILNVYINKINNSSKPINREDIAEYNPEDAKLALLYAALIIGKTKKAAKSITPFFILNSRKHKLVEIDLSVLDWLDIFWQTWRIFGLPLPSYERFQYDAKSQEFIKLDEAFPKEIPIKQIAWK